MTGNAAEPERPPALPHTRALVLIGMAGFVAATVLVIIANGITSRTWDQFGDDALLAGLAAWTQVTVVIGIVALVGAIVLAGVSEIARRTLQDITQQQERDAQVIAGRRGRRRQWDDCVTRRFPRSVKGVRPRRR